MSLTTVDNVMAFMSKESFTPLQTLTVQQLIPLVDEIIVNYCGWNLLAKTYEGEQYNGNGSAELDLLAAPVTTVTKVLVDGTDVIADIKVGKKEGVLLLTTGSFTVGRLNVEVDFTAGYDETTSPGDLQYAANYLVVINMTQAEDGTFGVKSDKLKDSTTEFNTNDLPPLVTRVLNRYRRIGLA